MWEKYTQSQGFGIFGRGGDRLTENRDHICTKTLQILALIINVYARFLTSSTRQKAKINKQTQTISDRQKSKSNKQYKNLQKTNH